MRDEDAMVCVFRNTNIVSVTAWSYGILQDCRRRKGYDVSVEVYLEV